MAASMLESVCSGRTTRSRRMNASASHDPTSRTVSVHCVRGAKSPPQSSQNATASAGTGAASARRITWRSWELIAAGSEPVTLEAPVERAPRKPERLRRETHIAAVAIEGLGDEQPLDVLQAHLLDVRRRGLGRLKSEIDRAHDAALGEERRALHRVPQLAHVSGPRVREQR